LILAIFPHNAEAQAVVEIDRLLTAAERRPAVWGTASKASAAKNTVRPQKEKRRT
jgi:hypothetical protein